MTLIELINKLNEIKDSYSSDKKSKVIFFAEDDYNAFDVEINNVEVEGNKIFLS